MSNPKRLQSLTSAVFALVFISAFCWCGCARLAGASSKAKVVPTIAVMADIQYGDRGEPQGGRNFRAALPNLEKCVEDLGQRDLAFVVQLGDTVDGYTNNAARLAQEHELVLRLLQQQKAPVYHVLGNHCLRVGPVVLRERYGLEHFYYDFTSPAAPGWRFVVLDGNDAGYGLVSEGATGLAATNPESGGIAR